MAFAPSAIALSSLPQAVTAKALRLSPQWDTEDNLTATLEFPGKKFAHAYLSWTAGMRKVIYTVQGTKGAVVVNDTKMGGYIPQNILVYIAVDAAQRGKGIGKKLMQEAIANATGGIALHVEPDNPAKRLYESLGFTNKYLEMRLQQ